MICSYDEVERLMKVEEWIRVCRLYGIERLKRMWIEVLFRRVEAGSQKS